MSQATHSNILLYLKALIWSVFVSYKEDTVTDIVESVRQGEINSSHPVFQNSHLEKCLRVILEQTPDKHSREHLAQCLTKVKSSEASMIYQNMVFEIGHYVTAKETVRDVPDDCPGIVYHIAGNKISVLFRKQDKTLSPQKVYPDQVLPVYTLTIPDPAL